MHIAILGDRRTHLPPGWTKERLVSVLGDSDLHASPPAEEGGSLTVIGLFCDTTVHVAPGSRVSGGGFTLFGDRHVDVPVPAGEATAINVNVYGLFCDVKVVVEAPTAASGGGQ